MIMKTNSVILFMIISLIFVGTVAISMYDPVVQFFYPKYPEAYQSVTISMEEPIKEFTVESIEKTTEAGIQ